MSAEHKNVTMGQGVAVHAPALAIGKDGQPYVCGARCSDGIGRRRTSFRLTDSPVTCKRAACQGR